MQFGCMPTSQASSIFQSQVSSPLMPLMADEAIGGPAPVLCLLYCLLSVMSLSGRMRICDRWMIDATVGRSPDRQLVHRTALLDKRSPRRADTSETPSELSGREPRKTSMSHQCICTVSLLEHSSDRFTHPTRRTSNSEIENVWTPRIGVQGCSHLPPQHRFLSLLALA